MRIRVCWYKNAGVAGYAEAFRPVQSDSQTSEWYSYFENDVLGDGSMISPPLNGACVGSVKIGRNVFINSNLLAMARGGLKRWKI